MPLSMLVMRALSLTPSAVVVVAEIELRKIAVQVAFVAVLISTRTFAACRPWNLILESDLSPENSASLR